MAVDAGDADGLRVPWAGRRVDFWFAGVLGVVVLAITVVVADRDHLPVLNPDDNIVPFYIRLPGMILLAFACDVIPRAGWRCRGHWRDFGRTLRVLMLERCSLSRVWFALWGIATWYMSYAAYRNLKSYAPFVNNRIWDPTFARIDKVMFLGHDPAQVLHGVFGSGLAAQFFACVYVAWLVMIPVSIAVALIWTSNRPAAEWFVTAMAVDMALGVAGYIALPTLGPIYSDPGAFAGLDHTFMTTMQGQLLSDRVAVLADPWHTDTVQTIAAFPSLHVGMMVTVALCFELFGVRRWIRIAGRMGVVLTLLATVYLGWHFFSDALAGIVVGALGVWIAALVTGNHTGPRPMLREESAAAVDEPGTASTPLG